eukprot:c27549_g1_i1 orf=3-1673(-)
MAPRILLCGDVLGRFNHLFKRVSAVNKANGPFDALLCVGQFFPIDNSDTTEMMEYIGGKKEIILPTFFIGDYGEGAELMLLSAKSRAVTFGPTMDGISICDNLYWLKGSGIFDLHGLRTAYLAGRYDKLVYKAAASMSSSGVYHEDDVDALRAFADDPGVVDLFITNEWPRGVLNSAGMAVVPPGLDPLTAGSVIVAELVTELRPRYHVAGSEGVFFAREPYSNEGVLHVTRFIGLAAVGNDKRQKFLHALSPTPASAMTPTELAIRPSSTTISPYKVSKGNNNSNGRGSLAFSNSEKSKILPPLSQLPEGQYWRFDTAKSKKRKLIDSGSEKVCFEFLFKGSCTRGDNCNFKHTVGNELHMPKGICFDFVTKGNCERGTECKFHHSLDEEKGRNGNGGDSVPTGVCFDFYKTGKCDRGDCRFSHIVDHARESSSMSSESCWFCLASPNIDGDLVVSIGEHCYCALAKGALVQDHVIILPIEHFPSTISLPQEVGDELEKYKVALRKYFKSQGNSMLVFERFLKLKSGTHAHLQVVPIPFSKASTARSAFVSVAKEL